jgi:hypothetical protein
VAENHGLDVGDIDTRRTMLVAMPSGEIAVSNSSVCDRLPRRTVPEQH